MIPRHAGRPARKVYTESMIRKVLINHTFFEDGCSCNLSWSPKECEKKYEDHIVDQLHKLWHETIGRSRSAVSVPQTEIYTAEEIEAMRPSPSPIPYVR